MVIRREIKSSALTRFRCALNSTDGNNTYSDKLHCHASIDFHHLLSISSLKDVYNDDIQLLKQDSNAWKVKVPGSSHSKSLYLHPSSVVSISLTNTSHQDTNDGSRSFAVWYTNPNHPGCTWFILPYYSLAIECSATTIISWDGRLHQHCSCTSAVGDPVYSIFNSSFHSVNKHTAIFNAMRSCKRKDLFLPGEKVYVRIKQMDFHKYELKRQDYGYFDGRWSILLATVSYVEKKKVFVKFLHSKLCEDTLPTGFSRNNVIHYHYVNKL